MRDEFALQFRKLWERNIWMDYLKRVLRVLVIYKENKNKMIDRLPKTNLA